MESRSSSSTCTHPAAHATSGLSAPLTRALVVSGRVNPYGYKHGRRYNENNVDLNRNVIMPGVEEGPAWVQIGIDVVLPSFGPSFVAVAVFLFAFTTLLSFAFYAETNLAYLIPNKKAQRICIAAARLLLDRLECVGRGAIASHERLQGARAAAASVRASFSLAFPPAPGSLS